MIKLIIVDCAGLPAHLVSKLTAAIRSRTAAPIVLANDTKAAVALANDTGLEPFEALENDAAGIDDDGWALIAPFGNHEKTRIFREGGQVKQQRFIQVLDNESADTLVNGENSFFRKLKRALVGIPVYKGHGDLNDVDPKAIANETQKIKLGVIDRIRKSARGVEAHFTLDNDGAQAVADGWKLPSAFWLVMPIGNEGDAIRARPFKLLSVALTQFPNISGVESLANKRDAGPKLNEVQNAAKQTETTQNKNTIMKQLLIGWLAAQGIALANDATDQAVFDAFNKEWLAKSTSVSALGNEKTTLTGTINTLTSARDAEKKRADETATALGNEQTARKAERKSAATFAVDLAIQRGRLTPADRETKIAALENSTNFEADVKPLIEGKPVIKTEAVSGKQSAALGNEQQQMQAEYQEAFKTELIATGQNAIQAHNNIMRLPKYSGLAARLAPATH